MSELSVSSDGSGGWLRVLLVLASLATAGVALWLLSVTLLVLPSRDPTHLDFWRRVAGGFLAYSALTWAYAARGRRSRPLWGAMVLFSCAAAAAGLYAFGSMIRTANAGGHFEGYIGLMGAVLCGHGVVGLTSVLSPRRSARRIGAV
jgi:hypothetical protein